MLDFKTLWNNHPFLLGDKAPCKNAQGAPNFENQCAICMGVALQAAGMNLSSFSGARCWFGHKHILRVEELIKWLKTQTVSVGTVQSFKGKQPNVGTKSKAAVAGKTGIVAWRNFWGRNNQGDHIDLWNGQIIAHGSLDYFDRAEAVLFWPIL